MEQLGFAIGTAIILFFGCAGMTLANYVMYRRSEQNLALSRFMRDAAIRAAIGPCDECCPPATPPQQSVT